MSITRRSILGLGAVVGLPLGVNDTAESARPTIQMTSIDVSKYGYDSSAIKRALKDAGPGGTVFLTHTSGRAYTLNEQLISDDVSVVSNGAELRASSDLGRKPAIVLRSTHGFATTTSISGIRLVGPGSRVLGQKTTETDGIRIEGGAMPRIANSYIAGFRRGLDYANNVGHISCDRVNCTNNYYGCYTSRNSGDYSFSDSFINGNTFANFGTAADQGWESLSIRDSHIGFAPYAFYQEQQPIRQGAHKVFLQDVILSRARFESIGNAAIWTDALDDPGSLNWTTSANWLVDYPGFSWNASYRIDSQPRTYAISLGYTEGTFKITSGSFPFSKGSLGVFFIRRANHAAWELADGTTRPDSLRVRRGRGNFVSGWSGGSNTSLNRIVSRKVAAAIKGKK